MRKLLALIRNCGNKTSKGTPLAGFTGIAMLTFIVVIFLTVYGAMYSYMRTYYRQYFEDDTNPVVILVNEPDSFKAHRAADDTCTYYNYNHPYVYDIAYFSNLMSERNANLVIVFNPDYQDGDTVEILTFYPMGDLEYADFRNLYSESVLESYKTYMLESAGVPVSYEPNSYVETIPLRTKDWNANSNSIIHTNATTLIPLIIFIAILYTAMSQGTTAVSSSKEMGTFASVILTPVSRFQIVLGYVINVWIKTVTPCLFVFLFLGLVPYYRAGLPGVIVLVLSMAFLISAFTILISIMNDSVVSSQTTYLPIFLIIIVLCVTCMQNVESYGAIYHCMPFYGQFLGIGSHLIGEGNWLYTLASSSLTILFGGVCLFVSEKLLHMDRFTVSSESHSDKKRLYEKKLWEKKEIRVNRKAKDVIYGYDKVTNMGHLSFISTQILRPLGLLAVFQTLALFPPLLLSSGKDLTEILLAFKEITTISGIVEASAGIMGVLMGSPLFLISMAVGYWLIIAAYVVKIKFIDKDSLSTIGITPKGGLKSYVKGLGLGLLLICSVFGVLILTGNISAKFNSLSIAEWGVFLAYVMMWIPQGATEEIMFRGFMMSRISTRYGKAVAVGISAFLFCIFHGLNPGFTVLALVNLVLYSVFYAIIAYKTDSIWILMAAHTAWNWAQGNIFGLEVSGNSNIVSIITSSETAKTNALWTGGGFGPEGGLAVTIIIVLAISLVLVAGKNYRRPKSQN